ncbi:Crp/Fnr family transcriptional regulator [Parapedobacter soli]|uniref:Crp/Fnr family transcriptional regulator n=1 Tax=Parapedobacter soli TaxID=416955 RepID=UPI0021C664D1|nr:Crp/Fnr family transcriptional regulator [Parapedobacter soli]
MHTFSHSVTAKRGTRVFEPGDHGDYVYFIGEGLLATVWWDEQGTRRIDRLLPPLHSVLTKGNLYAHHQIYCEVAALRPSRLIRIPADAFKAYKETCVEADTLVDVMEQKKLKQYRAKNRLMLIKDEQKRYQEFVADSYMKPFWLITSQQEQADYLNISRRTITRAMRGL